MTITIHDLRAWKAEGRRFVMLTAYDFPTAQILDDAGIPVLLVGDSRRPQRARLRERAAGDDGGDAPPHAGRRPRRRHAMVVGDMPFMSFQASVEDGVRNAGRLIKEGGAHAVKIEGPQLDLIHRLVDIGIPVMAHVGPHAAVGARDGRLQGAGTR